MYLLFILNNNNGFLKQMQATTPRMQRAQDLTAHLRNDSRSNRQKKCAAEDILRNHGMSEEIWKSINQTYAKAVQLQDLCASDSSLPSDAHTLATEIKDALAEYKAEQKHTLKIGTTTEPINYLACLYNNVDNKNEQRHTPATLVQVIEGILCECEEKINEAAAAAAAVAEAQFGKALQWDPT
jgi:hypothetical protein